MASPKQKTVAAIIAGVLVAVAPSFFAYLQARQEIREKYVANRDKAEAGYDAVVESIKELQLTVIKEHDYVVKLEGQVAALTSILTLTRFPTMTGSGTSLRVTTPAPLPRPPRAPERPDFEPSPAFNALP
jgi:type II secretory pathway pseudopilin PulG